MVEEVQDTLILDEPRKRKRVERFSANKALNGDSLDDVEHSKKQKKVPKPTVILWSQAERNRLERGLVLLFLF